MEMDGGSDAEDIVQKKSEVSQDDIAVFSSHANFLPLRARLPFHIRRGRGALKNPRPP